MATRSKSFEAKYPGQCAMASCRKPIHKGEMVLFVNDRIAHERCCPIGGLGPYDPTPDLPGDWHGDTDYEITRVEGDYIVTGRRNHEKPCKKCFLIHAGEECP
ncbi:hypothetical protein SEA_MRMIYAGI_94 [Mycobacterium phage MrMiyagi]|uniref:Uncharacterized protein n=1 Tax=Mycobacterium phage MrMiyagi TaxID=2762395 RepID=A0A7G8LPY5_9CAUD|nr:hypothetical protein SEA_MRMIYAGI_94 [Mycobacterium phage MrMiyagi]